MAETLVLVFKDGSRYNCDTGKVRSVMGMAKATKRHGDPVEIIGEGKIAVLLRKKYEQYNRGEWKSDVFGTAHELTGEAKDKIENDFNKVKRKIRL